MTPHRAISIAVTSLLDSSQNELDAAKATHKYLEVDSNWLVHMVSCTMCGILVNALLAIRKEMESDGQV